jgi:hypothetical protein
MKSRYVFVATAIVSFAFGLAFLLVPAQVASLYGAGLNGAAIFIARLFGGSLVMHALLAWLVRNSAGSPDREAIILAFLTANVIAVVVSMLAVLDGAVNALGWGNVTIYVLFGTAYGYLRFAGGNGRKSLATRFRSLLRYG